MKDISITFPSIRNSNLKKVCIAIDNACKKHTYEIIIASPYNQPKEINDFDIKWIKTFASPTVAWQQTLLLTNSEFWIDGSDDALFEENILDKAIDFYKSNSLQEYDVVSLILNEGTLDPETLEKLPSAETHKLPDWFFHVSYNIPFHKPCIDLSWKLSLNFLVKTEPFLKIGGYETSFEYINWALHDIILRLQSLGGEVYELKEKSLLVAHMPERTGDHGPVHDAQKGPDTDRFNQIYDNLKSVKDRAFIPLDNWKFSKFSTWWDRRFGKNH